MPEIPGVPGTSARIDLLFRDFIGTKTGKLLPTGNAVDMIDGVEVSMVDSAMPMMLLEASAVGCSKLGDPLAIDNDKPLLARLEKIRLEAGRRMGLGDVSSSVIPKVGLLERRSDCTIGIAYLMPWETHKAVAVTGAICLATACATPGTIAHRLARPFTDKIHIGHPSGIMELVIEREGDTVTGAGVLRTARRLFEGKVFVPAAPYELRSPMAAE